MSSPGPLLKFTVTGEEKWEGEGGYFPQRSMSVFAMSLGVSATAIPHSARIFFFASAVSSSPPTMAPAWPSTTARRRGGTGDESGDRLLAVVLCPAGSFGFCVAADLADHDDGFGFIVVVEHLQDVEMVGAVDRVAAEYRRRCSDRSPFA